MSIGKIQQTKVKTTGEFRFLLTLKEMSLNTVNIFNTVNRATLLATNQTRHARHATFRCNQL